MSRLSSTSLPWYRSSRPPRSDRHVPCIHEALARRAELEPDRVLLIDRHGCLSLGELMDAAVNRGRHLLAACGRPDAVVAVRLEPSVEAIVSYFACLAAGLRYLPLADYPPALMERLLRALSPDILIANDNIKVPEDLPIRRYAADEAKAVPPAISLPEADARRIAHCLPTSGTEGGVPKIVLTDHVGSMLSHEWRARLWGYEPDDVIGCNIFGVWDVVPALCYGVPAVMIDDETVRDPVSLASMIIQYGVTRMMLTPTLLDACLACDDGIDALRRLRRIVLCGEVVSRAVLEKAWNRLPGTRISNLYSISECHDVAAADLLPGDPVCTGYAADFVAVHITEPEDNGRLVPVGEAGRVLIGGAALANGYSDAGLTASRFLQVSLVDGQQERVYDTGDVGLLDEAGRLTVLGRIDEALKVRGSWVEPDLIAGVLREHPGVRRAVVVPDARQGGTQLSAFVVTGEPETPGMIASLRNWLTERVASQGVPSRIRVVERLPLMPSGKVDHRQLAEMQRVEKTASPGSEAKDFESLVLDAFREVLEQPAAAPDDEFERLGGDSLLAIMLCGELHRRTGKRVRVGDLLQHPTASALAAHLGRMVAEEEEAWELPSLGSDFGEPQSETGRSAGRRILVTGATGALGSALVGRLLADTANEVSVLVRGHNVADARRRLSEKIDATADISRLNIVVGDLAAPDLGLTRSALNELSDLTGAIIHAGADVDMFAPYRALEATNVGGTRELLRVAMAGGARFYFVSSSAVLPLGSESAWDEDSYGMDVARSLASQLEFSDGYSRSKLAAESLVWQAMALGLCGNVTRIPHLVGAGIDSRLINTIQLLVRMQLLPEGRWDWQVAPVDAVCRHLVSCVSADDHLVPLSHLTTRPITSADLLDVLGDRGVFPRLLPMPALVSRLLHDEADDLEMASMKASLNQLIAEFGPRAALSLADGKLETRAYLDDNPVRLLEQLILKAER